MIDRGPVTSQHEQLNGRESEHQNNQRSSGERQAFAAAHGASAQSWEQLARVLDRANRPFGRATPAVREAVRRIVREMMAHGASRDDIRGALTRAVTKHQRLLGRAAGELDVSVSEALLADVLHCAAAGTELASNRADAWER
jgi:hypothetical protein